MDKNYLLHDSKYFCIFPWLHQYVSPKGDVLPCCSTDNSMVLGSTKESSLEQVFNNDKTKEMRLTMLNDKPHDLCRSCYKFEESHPFSYRNFARGRFGHLIDVIDSTLEDGTVPEFKLRYIDVRFSNLCNFKCRTCGGYCSSQFAAEQKQLGIEGEVLLKADGRNGQLLQEVLSQIDNAEMIYFAGGEPLISDEHYEILEELIRRGRKDIRLRYNTNCSNLHYKQHDLAKLWGFFDHVEVSCSIDHYGDRAEYIRKGTNWAEVENNIKVIRDMPNVELQYNTVLSVFNYPSIHEFYDYMIKNDLIREDERNHFICTTSNPLYYSATSLPKDIKYTATQDIKNYIDSLDGYHNIKLLLNLAIEFATPTDTWEESRIEFNKETKQRDRLRRENFSKVFPELAEMIIE
jgi:pyruvate-formate lyase-activating enzyme